MPFQLANKFESFQKMGKQSGFYFYVPAWNTSKTDPATGYHWFPETKIWKSKHRQRNSLRSLIQFISTVRQLFWICFDYKNFTEKADGGRTKWTVCTPMMTGSHGTGLWTTQGWSGKKYDVTERLKSLFDGKVEYKNSKDLKSQIVSQESADFFKALMKIFIHYSFIEA